MPKIGMEPLRRQALIDATISAIGEHGSLDVTMSDIAGRAGVSSALAHHYFGAKEDLLQATMRHLLADLGRDTVRALSRAATPRERVSAVIAVNFSAGQFRAETIGAWLAFYVEAQRSHAIAPAAQGLCAAAEFQSAVRPVAAAAARRGRAHGRGDRRDDRRALHPPRAEGRPAQSGKRRRAGRGLRRDQTPAGGGPMSRRPNILIVMVDQLNGTLFPDGPADFLHVPHLKALAARSARFANNYTASPLCAPGRASFMSGQLPSRTRVYDNAAEFASDIPTYRASSARRRLLHLPVRQDAFRRPRPAARLRGAADHRHLSGRFRLDAGLPQARRAHRLVVSQSRLGRRRRRRRNHQPDGI